MAGGFDVHRRQIIFDRLDRETGEVKRVVTAPRRKDQAGCSQAAAPTLGSSGVFLMIEQGGRRPGSGPSA